MRVLSLIFLILFSSSTYAAEVSAPCPDPSKLKNLCMMVSSRMPLPATLGTDQYRYQHAFKQAACVNEANDSPAIAAEKIRQAWAAAEDKLVCNSVQFDVQAGNVLKFAVSTKFDDFIDEVLTWKINLNRVDPHDQRTVLDYIQYHIQKNEGNELQGKFQRYYQLFRKAGAKHKSEL